jgi:hypothetical protein
VIWLGYYKNDDGELISYTHPDPVMLCRSFRHVEESLREANETIASLERERTELEEGIIAALGVGGAITIDEDVSVVVEPTATEPRVVVVNRRLPS